MRKELPIGTVIRLESDGFTRDFCIEKVIGDGASCIAYEAYQCNGTEQGLRYRIKECYPYDAQINRVGISLVWSDENERIKAYSRLKKAHNLTVELRNDATTGNNITNAQLYEGNGTLYSVMEINHAITYDKMREDSLLHLLQTILVLTKTVGNLHSKGYLHLDIKPSNFLVSHKPNTYVWLFDVDSIIAEDELKAWNLNCTTYSDGWAAPEQLLGQIEKLCYATDLYAIGAILFSRIMDRPVCNDDTSLFADWDMNVEMLMGVNPQIAGILKNVFKKTLAASAKRRYQSARELETELEGAVRILIAGDPYILPDEISCSAHFVGRQKELAAIYHAFQSGARVVCLKGMGGIGKSELAKRYAELHAPETCVFCTYRGKSSVDELIEDITIQQFKGTLKEKKALLRKLLDANTLLIIDELDAEDTAVLEFLNLLHCRVLITSRLAWDEYGSFETIIIDKLENSDQVALFVSEYGASLTSTESSALTKILSLIEGYTLLIPLLAKQLRKGTYSFEQMLNNIREAGIKGTSEGKVRHLKDGSIILSGSLYGILQKVLNLAELSDNQIDVMRSLALMSGYYVEKRALIDWIGKCYIDTLDELIFCGWIQMENIRKAANVTLHTVIAGLCIEEYRPSIVNCKGILNRLWAFASEFEHAHKDILSQYFGGYAATDVDIAMQRQYDAFTALIRNLIDKSDWNDAETNRLWIFLIEKVVNVIYGDYNQFTDFLSHQFKVSMKTGVVSVSSFSRLMLAMQTIELLKGNGEVALIYAKLAVAAAKSLENAEEMKFRACYIVYQYICREFVDGNEYWKMSQFADIVAFVGDTWQDIVDSGAIDLEDNDIWVKEIAPFGNKQDWNGTTLDAVEQAYNDFVFKASEEGIAFAAKLRDPFGNPSIIPTYAASDYSSMLKSEISASDFRGWYEGDIGHAITQYKIMRDLYKDVLKLVLGEACPISDMFVPWNLYGSIQRTEAERKSLDCQLKLLDVPTMHITPLKPVRCKVISAYADWEAAFLHGYAMTEDWDKYEQHKKQLMLYYSALIFGKSSPATLSDIRTHLPGASSLCSEYGRIIPPKQSLKLIIDILKLLEEHNARHNYRMEALYEVYELALKIASEAGDQQMIAYFERRVRALSSVHFSAKED